MKTKSSPSKENLKKRSISSPATKSKLEVKGVDKLVVIQSIAKSAKPLQKELAEITIRTAEDFNHAANLLKQLKAIDKAAKEQEATIAIPLKQALGAVSAHFKPFHTLVAELDADIKLKMSVFLEKNKVKQIALAGKLSAGEVSMSQYVNKNNALEISSPSASIRQIKQLKIVDADKIPRKFLTPDEKAILIALKEGIKVPGCELELVDNIAI